MAYLAGDQVRAGGDGVKRCTTHHLLTNGGKTGHPPGLLQDDCRKLSKWLASRVNARQEVREVCRLIAQEQTMDDKTEQSEKQQATMSLAELEMRDYFAAQAIGPLLQQIEAYPDENWRLGLAIDAYAMADAMLAARES